MIKDKSVYDPTEPDDGYRVLVMRVVRDKSILERHNYDLWMRSLGPSADSLRRWWAGDIDTDQFFAEFRDTVSRRALARLHALERRHGAVTVLCREQRPDPCHRYALVDLYRALYPASGASSPDPSGFVACPEPAGSGVPAIGPGVRG